MIIYFVYVKISYSLRYFVKYITGLLKNIVEGNGGINLEEKIINVDVFHSILNI